MQTGSIIGRQARTELAEVKTRVPKVATNEGHEVATSSCYDVKVWNQEV